MTKGEMGFCKMKKIVTKCFKKLLMTKKDIMGSVKLL